MSLDIRYCKKCKRAYDIGLNFETCPDCRYGELNEVKEGVKAE